eukprot:c19596_g1_i1.p1 GENE.c19596_g1_i1~~c19596_g1_i1.p1  ORF type:complete len:472 (+),score=78.94 c19596_g1_i1:145-1560(+)
MQAQSEHHHANMTETAHETHPEQEPHTHSSNRSSHDRDGSQNQLPASGSTIFVGGLPREITDEIMQSHFESVGPVFSVRIVRERETGECKGFGFVNYTAKDSAHRALEELQGSDLMGRSLRLSMSENKTRLYVGNIGRYVTKDEFRSIVEQDGQVRSIEMLQDAFDAKKNRGFAFVDYFMHEDAARALKRMTRPPMSIGGSAVSVDWAEPKEELDEEAMRNVKTIYVRNLPPNFSEANMRDLFEPYGVVERIALPKETTGMKWKNFGFVYFDTREAALSAIDGVHGRMVDDRRIDVTLAKPFDKAKARRGAVMRDRGRGGDRGRGRGHHHFGYEDRGPRHRDRYDEPPPWEGRERGYHDAPPYHDYRPPPREYGYAPDRRQDGYGAPPPAIDHYAQHAIQQPTPAQAQMPVFYSPTTGQYVTRNAAGQYIPIDLSGRAVAIAPTTPPAAAAAYQPPYDPGYDQRSHRYQPY